MNFFKQLGRHLREPFNRRVAVRRLKAFHSRQRTIEEIVQKAMHFGSAGFYRVRTTQKRSEIISLAYAVQALRPSVILEIGTAHGGTLFIWSQLALELVISCDLMNMERKQYLYKRFPPPGSRCEVFPISGDSHSITIFSQVKQLLNGRKVDFLFIDGDHTLEGVTADFNMYYPLVRAGGLIAFHDILQNQPTLQNQVYLFWKELKPRFETLEFVDNPNQCGFGIGLVKIPSN